MSDFHVGIFGIVRSFYVNGNMACLAFVVLDLVAVSKDAYVNVPGIGA